MSEKNYSNLTLARAFLKQATQHLKAVDATAMNTDDELDLIAARFDLANAAMRLERLIQSKELERTVTTHEH